MKVRTLLFILLVLALLLVAIAVPALAQDDTPDIPTVPVTEPTQPPEGFVPEASSLMLLGSGAAGLAGYIGLQIRARRRR